MTVERHSDEEVAHEILRGLESPQFAFRMDGHRALEVVKLVRAAESRLRSLPPTKKDG